MNIKIKDSRDNQILILTEKLYYKYQKQFIESFIKTWTFSYIVTFKPENAHDTSFERIKICDMIAFFNFSIPDFNKMIIESDVFKEQRLKYRRTGIYISTSDGRFDCAILAMYFGFLKYKKWKFIEDLDSRKQALRETWYSIVGFLKEFTKSTHPQVDIWVINIYTLAAKKFPTQEIIGEYSIKKMIHIHENKDE